MPELSLALTFLLVTFRRKVQFVWTNKYHDRIELTSTNSFINLNNVYIIMMLKKPQMTISVS